MYFSHVLLLDPKVKLWTSCSSGVNFLLGTRQFNCTTRTLRCTLQFTTYDMMRHRNIHNSLAPPVRHVATNLHKLWRQNNSTKYRQQKTKTSRGGRVVGTTSRGGRVLGTTTHTSARSLRDQSRITAVKINN